MDKYIPLVSVIIPSYNHAPYIKECIQSVLDQTFTDFECLIEDDGSKDNTVEVIKTFKDSRINFVANPKNSGACAVANNLIKKARGKYIASINSDDIWVKDKLEKQVKFMEENPNYGAVLAKPYFIDKFSNIIIN